MGEAGIWIVVILVGFLVLGLREYARTSGTFSARLEQVKMTLVAGTMILLGVTASVLTVLFIAVIIVPEIWRPLLGVLAVIIALAAFVFWARRPRRE